MNQEQILLALQDAAPPLQDLVRDESIEVDSTPAQTVVAVFDQNVFDDTVFATGQQLDRDEVIPVESLATLSREVGIPIDVIHVQARDESIPVESLATLSRVPSIPIEAGRGQQRDESIPVETQPPQLNVVPVFDVNVFDQEVFRTGIQLDRNESVPIDNTGTAVAEIVPVFDVNVFDQDVFSTGIQIDRDESIPIDTGAGVILRIRDESIPIDVIIASLLRDESIPIDTGVGAVQLIRDEGIPIDTGVAPVPPSEFIFFTGGSPTWWLRPAPLLARSQHCGRIRLGGRSHERWRPAVQRAILVTLPVRRGRKPAPPEPIVYQSQAVLWVGGRSETNVFGMRQQVVRDDEEVMQLLMLIDSGA